MAGFIGGFNKKKNIFEKNLLESFGYSVDFNEKIYEKVSKDIIDILGKKDVYTGQDAYKYFRAKYFAYPIDITRFYDYIDTTSFSFTLPHKGRIENDGDIEYLSCMQEYYCFIKDNNGELTNEHNMTLLIETSCNQELFKKFPSIVEYNEKIIKNHNLKKRENGSYYDTGLDGKEILCGGIYENTILVIGSLDGKYINSMKIILGGGEAFPEIEYDLEFFRRNS